MICYDILNLNEPIYERINKNPKFLDRFRVDFVLWAQFWLLVHSFTRFPLSFYFIFNLIVNFSIFSVYIRNVSERKLRYEAPKHCLLRMTFSALMLTGFAVFAVFAVFVGFLSIMTSKGKRNIIFYDIIDAFKRFAIFPSEDKIVIHWPKDCFRVKAVGLDCEAMASHSVVIAITNSSEQPYSVV